VLVTWSDLVGNMVGLGDGKAEGIGLGEGVGTTEGAALGKRVGAAVPGHTIQTSVISWLELVPPAPFGKTSHVASINGGVNCHCNVSLRYWAIVSLSPSMIQDTE